MARWRSWGRSASGTSSSSQIVINGSRSARWSAISAGEPLSVMVSSRVSTVRWVHGRSASTCGVVNALLMSLRTLLSSGGSMRLIDSDCAMGAGVIRGKSRPTRAARLKRRSEVTVFTSSYRVTSQQSPSPYGMRTRVTGASVRIRVMKGSGSRASSWRKGQVCTESTPVITALPQRR